MAREFDRDTLPDEEADVRLDAHSIERIARRVAEILRSESSTSGETWLTAAEVAERYSVSRAWVYDNAQRLGASRLGDGNKARLRFDPVRLQAHFSEDNSQPESPRPQRDAPRRWIPEGDLIPIRGH